MQQLIETTEYSIQGFLNFFGSAKSCYVFEIRVDGCYTFWKKKLLCYYKCFPKIHCSNIFEKVATISHADIKILNAKWSRHAGRFKNPWKTRCLISKLEGKKSVLYSDLYVGIRLFIFQFIVLYLRSSCFKGDMVFLEFFKENPWFLTQPSF